MVAVLILSLALFSGVASTFRLDDVGDASNKVSKQPSVLQRYPTVVQVDVYDAYGWMQMCAGTILNELYIMSAATCFSGIMYPGPLYRRTRAGAEHRHEGGVINYVDREYNFERNDTDRPTFTHDISVVRLSDRLFFTHLIRPSPILQQGAVVPSGIRLSQLGWNSYNDTDNSLSSASVTTFILSSNSTHGFNSTSNIITAYPSAHALLSNDPGSPWLWANITVGITPWYNTFDTGSERASYATSVAAYTNWIVSVAR